MSLQTDLAVYLRMDSASGDEIDEIGAITLTETNGAIASATGKVGNGRDLESGSSQYFTAASAAPFLIGSSNATWQFWVKLESKATSQRIVGKFNTAGNQREYTLLYNTDLDCFAFVVSDDGTATTTVLADNHGAVSTGVWYHVIAEHDADNDEIRIRVNNGTPDVTAHSTGLFEGSAPFRIGSHGGTAGLFLDGVIDEVGLWKRLLTDIEINALYGGGNGLAFTDFGFFRGRSLGLLGIGY